MNQTQPLAAQTFGKWILSGEHAVLRGSEALVFPLKAKGVHLSFLPGENELTVACEGNFGNEASLIIWDILGKACEQLQISRSLLRGHLKIQCEVPLGAGLGASAALVCAITRWLSKIYPMSEREIFEFSRQLENIFHGESSGVDIAVSLKACPLVFQKEKDFQELHLGWEPTLILSYSGQKGITKESVKKVKDLFLKDPELAKALDQKMVQSVELAKKSLKDPGGLPLLVESLDLALEAFRGWGLVPEFVETHLGNLKDLGALAVKPTGSGMGGYVLSLWSEPKEIVLKKLHQEPRATSKPMDFTSCF